MDKEEELISKLYTSVHHPAYTIHCRPFGVHSPLCTDQYKAANFVYRISNALELLELIS